MCVNTGVACSAGQILVFPVRYVLMCACVAIFLGQAKVYDIYKVAFLAESHQEVVGLHVAMNEVLRMNIFYAADLKQRTYCATDQAAADVKRCNHDRKTNL